MKQLSLFGPTWTYRNLTPFYQRWIKNVYRRHRKQQFKKNQSLGGNRL